jgi:hypothetical protein
VDDPQAAFDLGLGRESPSPFAHRLETNAWSWKSLVGMGHLQSENGPPARTRSWAGRFEETVRAGFSAQRRRVTKTLPEQTAYRKPSHSGADIALAQSHPETPPMRSPTSTVQEQRPANLAALHQSLKEMGTRSRPIVPRKDDGPARRGVLIALAGEGKTSGRGRHVASGGHRG